MRPLITLTTDFGEQDPYVAAMKGVIASRNPEAAVLDLTHALLPHDIRAAALFLEGAAPYFPAGTIHVAVIDPGVGTSRHPIAVQAADSFFVCPDNGLLTLALKQIPLTEARIIANPACMRTPVSPTFHGRDIFAPTAAFLAAGNSLREVGPVLDTLCTLELPEPGWVSGHTLRGAVIHVDHFGTLVTNILRSHLDGTTVTEIRVGPIVLGEICSTFGDVPAGNPAAFFGSSGRLEIAVNCGHAARQFGLERDAAVELEV